MNNNNNMTDNRPSIHVLWDMGCAANRFLVICKTFLKPFQQTLAHIKLVTIFRPSRKLGRPKVLNGPQALKSWGTRPTGHIGWLRLWFHVRTQMVGCPSNLFTKHGYAQYLMLKVFNCQSSIRPTAYWLLLSISCATDIFSLFQRIFQLFVSVPGWVLFYLLY